MNTLTSMANPIKSSFVQEGIAALTKASTDVNWLPTKEHDPHGPTFAKQLASDLNCKMNASIQRFQGLSRKESETHDDTLVLPLLNFWETLHKVSGELISNFRKFVGLDKQDFIDFKNRELETLMAKLESPKTIINIHKEGSSTNLLFSLFDGASLKSGDRNVVRVAVANPTSLQEKPKILSMEFPAQGALSGHGNQEMTIRLTPTYTEFAAGETPLHQREGKIELDLGNDAFEKLSSFIQNPEFKIRGSSFADRIRDYINA